MTAILIRLWHHPTGERARQSGRGRRHGRTGFNRSAEHHWRRHLDRVDHGRQQPDPEPGVRRHGDHRQPDQRHRQRRCGDGQQCRDDQCRRRRYRPADQRQRRRCQCHRHHHHGDGRHRRSHRRRGLRRWPQQCGYLRCRHRY